jgi:hypothetical protein
MLESRRSMGRLFCGLLTVAMSVAMSQWPTPPPATITDVVYGAGPAGFLLIS